MKNLPKHIDYIKGDSIGPCVVIAGAIHGDERLGEAVIAKLRHEIQPKNLCGDLILILGNPEAYAAHKRFIDCDLNRLFCPNFNAIARKKAHTLNIEEKRALEIAPYLEMADFFLDIHSTIKPSVPFIYCERTQEHYRLASLFNTQYIVSADFHCRIPDLTSCTDNLVDRKGGIGITYEAGWHRGPTIFPEVMDKIYQFLHVCGSLKLNAAHAKKPVKPEHLIIYDYLIPQTPDFHFKKDFSNFDIVKEGETIAEDNGKCFKAKKKSFVVFPKIEILPGAPACYLAVKKKIFI